jgi:hypothetical protein
MTIRWLVPLLAAGALIAGAGQVSAHGGVDDGDGDPDLPPVINGTPLEELYPGFYKFQDQFTAFGSGWARSQGGAAPAVSASPTEPAAP